MGGLMVRNRASSKVFAILLFTTFASVVGAQDSYPNKPVLLVVPWPPGAGTDVVHRAAARLAEIELGKTIVVQNKPGAAGVIGSREIENAAPDGYLIGGMASTVLLTQYTALSPTDWKKYEPVAMLTFDPAGLAVRVDSPMKNLRDFIEYARANPGQVKVGNSGAGGFHHVSAALLENTAGIKLLNVPYKGSSDSVVATMGGQIDAVSADTSALYAQLQTGKLRLLGLASKDRHPMFPDVPTYAEQGLDIQIGVRRLVVTPKGTPAAIVSRLEKAYLKAAADPQFTKLKGGWIVDVMNARDTALAMERDDLQVRHIVDVAGLRVQKQ